jgi:hypothetical protein
MDDSEIKKLLLETCPVRPGQEERAWAALRDRLYAQPARHSRWEWLHSPGWRGALAGLMIIGVLAVAGHGLLNHHQPLAFLSARSASPGISATSFYSPAADAQVVWISGMEAATDRPTYLDPSGPTDGGDPASGAPANL